MKSSPKTKPRSRSMIYLAVILGLALIAGFFYNRQRQIPLPISYREAVVSRGNLEVRILSTGNVEPENRLEIKPPVAGRVEQVLVKEGQRVRKGQILAWMSSTERAALLDAARSQGSEEVKKWELNYKPTPIIAPIFGTIILRNVESGQIFSNSDPVFTMSDRLTVKAQVDETDMAEVKLKQTAVITLDAYPKQEILAEVAHIAYDAKTVNNVTTYLVDVLPKATPEHMRSGMTANVSFLVAAKQSILLVPNDALRVHENEYSVLIKGSEKKPPSSLPVKTGLTDGKQTEIVSGLSEGQTILIAEIRTPTREESGTKNPLNPFGGGRGIRR